MNRSHGSDLTVVSDGRSINQNRDPPGQRSVYIPPGQPERETYRLSTFKDFPSNVPVDVRRLASRGFYFTGYKDRVKCFSCGQCLQDWTVDDNPGSDDWHRSDCELIRGTDTTNVPLQSFLHRLGLGVNPQTQPSTSQRWNTTNTVTSSAEVNTLARASSDTTVTSQPVTSHTSNIGLTTTEFNSNVTIQANVTITTSSQSASFTSLPRSTSPPSVIAATRANQVSHRNVGILQANMNLFPCSNPVNPHMRSEESRLQTFLDHSSSWPAHRIRATPRQISNAGMYYLGVRDRVKCWYCNGGLQNWERDDDPWEEHAKWFPLCEFTLQQRGPDFVHSMVSRFPNLRRPILRNPANPLPLRRSNQENIRGPEIIDPREEVRNLERKIDEEMSSSELVEQAKLMGFDERMIRAVFKRKYEATGNGFSRFETLVESILAIEEESVSNRSEEGRSTSATAQATPSTSTSNLSTTSGLQEIRRLQEERMCKVCGNEQASVVLIPCGHIACCVGCAENASTCPICRLRVREKVRSFIV
ncbi:inhibitor of apoptosis protein-like isoform X1 [Clavelina lepadiformis]|uniref:inhibitor of apoptosis protein-like isoform X1 n=1 Tax=Clavelina lepadiformis TaxID=159417 RepID=UPI00404365E5